MVTIINSSSKLNDFCKQTSDHSYVTIDTEFLRERTYYPKLCLIQLAFPGPDDKKAAIVDVQAPGLNLDPFYELLKDRSIIKVFHAARQDLEIFFSARKIFPRPFFDTQVAAMVCGFGEQVAYETLVRKLAMINLDKSSRFTDWSYRPLSDQQINYAISDVTHLRVVYEELKRMLNDSGREKWVEEELSSLLRAETYESNIEDSWKKIRIKNKNPNFVSIVKALAMFRENHARKKNVPRGRILKDEMILELANIKPNKLKDLKRSRLLHEDSKKGWLGNGIISAFQNIPDLTEADLESLKVSKGKKANIEGLTDLLKVLLKFKSEEFGVAQKLIASNYDLEMLASDQISNLPTLKGWRKKIFGDLAIQLKNGQIGLSVSKGSLKIIKLQPNKEVFNIGK